MERDATKAEEYNFSITDFQNADERALKFIVMGHWKGLVYFARNYLTDQQEAEDTVQDVFGAVWNKRFDFPDYENLRRFMYISVRNRALDKMEAQKRYSSAKRRASKRAEDHVYEPLSSVELKEMAMASTLQAVVNLADKHLPPKTRQVFLMSLDGLNDREIADQLNIARQNVTKYRQKAMITIRKHFQKNGLVPSGITLLIYLCFLRP